MIVAETQERIPPETVQEIVELRKQKTNLKGICEQKNVSVPTISKILKRELGDFSLRKSAKIFKFNHLSTSCKRFRNCIS
ncbi:hypothetical protein LCGC14_1332690 [marine sediment metagenome]|uniref:Uncharacterized protein n=1 Tax=marine sediment metagenome TaxID=412755 RepID=A0A0F9KFZ9_9ZZZZ